MNRWRALVVMVLGGCTFGMSGGGAYSVQRSPEPRPGGFHGRVLAGAGWGTRYGNLSAVAGVSHVAKRGVYSVGAEMAIAFRPWKPAEKPDLEDDSGPAIGGPALLGRVLYSGKDDIRLTELAIGPGAGVISSKHGPGTLALYATVALLSDEAGRHGWSHGIEVSFSVPISIVGHEMHKDLGRR